MGNNKGGMMDKLKGLLACLVLCLLVSGCASEPQKPVGLTQNSLVTPGTRIGVVMTTLPKVDTHLPGADCLLCLAVASAANSKLTTHTKTLTVEDLPKLKDTVADLIRKQGAEVTVINEDIKLDSLPDSTSKGENSPKKDFKSLQTKYGVDKLLVIDVTVLGIWRTYSAYVPTSDPQGNFQATGYIVNLSTNAYEWYLPVNILKSADGAWDEPPNFPGLTNAYFQALEMGKDSILKPFRE